MLASLLYPGKRRRYTDRPQLSSLYAPRDSTPNPAEPTNRDTSLANNNNLHLRAPVDGDVNSGYTDNDQHDDAESAPLLPRFTISHLDALPVYDITHAIRLLIASRCETTLSYDQLRSPQISQFLVKPIQQKIIASYFSRATLYALMANCLQFNKEVQLDPGNSGTSRSRAMVSELLAIKLSKEYTTRELIDALSFEFYPLQGQHHVTSSVNPPSGHDVLRSGGTARISCLEVAIRAQAKRFLAHPLVVQQLEAIWAGTIVFHSAADTLHHSQGHVSNLVVPATGTSYGTSHSSWPSHMQVRSSKPSAAAALQRSVTLYDPMDASLFKLSRLRVPRYRQVLSTLSFAVLLGLFLAVLQQRRLQISPLEIVFWFWSAGFMLDEIVGFSEQGFSLYLMSFWNLFDLGILLLLFCYYCMRIYGALLPYTYSEAVANQAYDILAANAVFLFPRLFSVLDHYRYFSQLLIAFRIMASDLVAVFVLIIIACSGFFISFTLSFGSSHPPASIAYALFQIVMGFTPAAWSLWDEYNLLGRIILILFLFICHFVVVTILITVLTNSFMRIVQNANQEHQFLFAVNTISMVKSDALFSYVAPANILGWLIIPLRYLMPFHRFVKLNRTIIKVTHLHILFAIFFYEKAILCSGMIRSPGSDTLVSARASARSRPSGRRHFQIIGSNTARLVREPSVATYQKDCVLDEVFRPSLRNGVPGGTQKEIRRPPGSNVVNNWMQAMSRSPANPPDEQDSDEVDRLERLPRVSRFTRQKSLARTARDVTKARYSAVSDPEELIGRAASSPTPYGRKRGLAPLMGARRFSRQTDNEGDDELTSEGNNDLSEGEKSSTGRLDDRRDILKTYNQNISPPVFYNSRPPTARPISRRSGLLSRPKIHARNISNSTMLYNPVGQAVQGAAQILPIPIRPEAQSPERPMENFISVSVDQRMLPRHSSGEESINNVAHQMSDALSIPEPGGFPTPEFRARERRRPPIPIGLGSDMSASKDAAGAFLGPAPSSLTTQMAYVTEGIQRAGSTSDRQDMLSKLVLARMNNIEEGFREVIKEVKDLRRVGPSRGQSRPRDLAGSQPWRRRLERKETKATRNKDNG